MYIYLIEIYRRDKKVCNLFITNKRREKESQKISYIDFRIKYVLFF